MPPRRPATNRTETTTNGRPQNVTELSQIISNSQTMVLHSGIMTDIDRLPVHRPSIDIAKMAMERYRQLHWNALRSEEEAPFDYELIGRDQNFNQILRAKNKADRQGRFQ